MAVYRVFGPLRWVSANGNAVWAVHNPTTNQTIRILRADVLQSLRRLGVGTNTQHIRAVMARGTTWTFAGDKKVITPIAIDPDVSLPAGVVCGYAGVGNTEESLFRVMVYKNLNPALALACMASGGQGGRYAASTFGGEQLNSALESVTVQAGESVTFTLDSVERGFPVAIQVRFVTESGPDRIFSTYHTVMAMSDQHVLWGVAVDSGGPTVRILSIQITELGHLPTPFFQLVRCVPTAQALADTSLQHTPMKFDPGDSAFPGVVMLDAVVRPAGGIAEVAIADSSTGTPKGVNYLHTRDFVGPVLGVLFPEYDVGGPGVDSDALAGSTPQYHRIVNSRAPVYIRPGETVGLVVSAETAIIATAVPLAGMMPMDFALTLDAYVEPVDVTVTVIDNDNSAPVSGARVLLLAADDTGDLPFEDTVTAAKAGGIATVTHTGHGLTTGQQVLVVGADQPEFNGVHTITRVDANTYTYPISAGTVTATGTITATGVVLYGATDGSGMLTTQTSYFTDQPVSGRVRRATSGTLYKTSPLVGTISATAGFAATVILLRDQ